MKRYAIFTGDEYPYGGWGDLHRMVDDLGETRNIVKDISRDRWYQIVDLQDGRIIQEQEKRK